MSWRRAKGVGGVLGALAIVLGTAWGVVVVHEHGHRLVARLLGVPASDVTVVYGFPSHTALMSGDTWLAPDDDGYVEAFRAHRSGAGAGWFFIAAGFLVESLAILVLCLVLLALGVTYAALLGAVVSAVIFVGYVLVDLFASVARRAPHGDASAMWGLLPAPTLVLLLVLLVTKGATLALIWARLSS